MRFSYAESMVDPSFYLPLARAAEEAGYDGMVVPDSICYPLESDSTYPFSPDHTREFLEDKPFIEPFSLIPAMGAVTERLRFITFVLKLPMRHPLLVAKQATSVAVLTGNRLALGRGHQPLAGGLPVLWRALGGPGASDGRGHRHRPGPLRRWVLRVPRRGVRPPAGQDQPDPDRTAPDPGRRPCPGRPSDGPLAPTAGSTAAATRPTFPASSSASASCGRRRARQTGTSRST